MKKAIILFVAFMAIVSMSSCRIEKVYGSSDDVLTHKLNLKGFTSVSNAGSCDVHFTQSPTYKVPLKASQRWYDSHAISVEDGTLVIRGKGSGQKQKGVSVINMTGHDGSAEIWISAPSLEAVSMSGSGDFTLDSNFKGKDLTVSVRGSSVVKMKDITLSGNFEYTVSGSGDVEMGTVKANNANIAIFGSGDVESKLVNVAQTNVHVSGSGDANLDFSDCGDAQVSVTGSGDITLSGQLQTLSKQVSGSGDVNTMKLRLGK